MNDSGWVFPPIDTADEYGVVGVGADLAPTTLLQAYSNGLFPMPLRPGGDVAWWSPDPRAILPLDGLHVSRSLRKSMRRFTLTVNTEFEEVIRRCGDPKREHGWIDDQIIEAFVELHELGFAHSVETRLDDHLVGGIYGVGLGSFFAGESMFHEVTDASKAALAHLVERLNETECTLFDVQWLTPHLESLGAIEIPRSEYAERLAKALTSQPERPKGLQ